MTKEIFMHYNTSDMDNEIPIYNQTLQQEKIELHEIMMILKTMRGQG
jgi:hypothetical protein